MAKKATYDNESISSLKGADRVRKRPGVIFGSDGLEGCEHAVFEILSNAIDEARGGHGKLITVTRFADRSIQVEDQGRGCPVDWNEKEGRYNWELVFCELYAGGKYDNENSENYEYSLGLNGLGSCATQYASRYMDVTVWRDGKEYRLHFERGEIAGELEVSEQTGNEKRTGTTIRWLPDLDVFTDIDIPVDYYRDVMRRQAVVNAGVTFRLKNETAAGKFETEEFVYEHGIEDYMPGAGGDGCPDGAGVLGGGAPGPGSGGQAGVQGEAQCSAAAFPTRSHVMRALPQLQLPGARRQPGEGHPLGLCLRHRQVPAGQQQVHQGREPRSPSRTCRTAWCWSATTSPPRPATKTRPRRPSPTSSSRRP